jgi:hypothetical protein
VQLLPHTLYENKAVPNVGELLYVIPEGDDSVAGDCEITATSPDRFTCGGFDFSHTGSFGHVGRNVLANAYSSYAVYCATVLIPHLGWNAHERRRDVFTRVYTNAKITPHIKRIAFIQIDQRKGSLVFLGQFLGEGGNMLAQLSDYFLVDANDPEAPSKIRDYLTHADGIILASYAMNVSNGSALGLAGTIGSGENFGGVAE